MKYLHLVIGVLLTCSLALATAQENTAEEPGNNSTTEYHQENKRLIDEHFRRLAEIDAAYREAVKAHSEENKRRVKELSEESRASHEELAIQDVPAAERGEEAKEIQEKFASKRKEHAEWRDSTYSKILEDHAAQRKAQFDAHNAAMALRAGGSQNDVSGSPPQLEQPRLGVEEPEVSGPPRRPVEAQVNPETTAQVNTQAAPAEFDISLWAIDSIKFEDMRLDDGELRAYAVVVMLTVANRGSSTYAFDNNRINVVIEEGVRDRSEGSQGMWEVPLSTEADYDFAIPVEHGQQVWVPVRYHNPGGARKELRDRIKRFFKEGLRGSRLVTGDRPAVIKPHIWYTVDVRLSTPAEYDRDTTQHGAYLHMRFDNEGSIVEQDGPFFFTPPSYDHGKF